MAAGARDLGRGGDGGGWAALLVTLAAQVMVAVAALALPVAAPVIALSLQFPVEETGRYMAAMFGASMLATLGAGSLVLRHGAIRVSQGGLLLCALGLAVCTLGSRAALVTGMLLVGLGYGPITPASSHLLARTTPPHRMAMVFSVKQTGVPLGGMLAGALVPALLLAGGWRTALLAVAAACVACAAAAAPLRAALDAERDGALPLKFATFVQPLRLVTGSRPLLSLALVSMLFCSVQLAFTTYLVAYLHSKLGYSLVAAGLVLAVAQASGACGRVLWGHVADRWVPPHDLLAVLGALVAAGSIALGLLQPQAPLLVVCLLLAAFGACAIGWNGVYLAEVARRAPPGMASGATAGALVFTYTGMVGGPVAFAFVVQAADSYRVAFAALAAPAALSVLLLVLRRRHAANAHAGM